MIRFKIQYFNKYGFEQSTEIVQIPIAMIIGAKQDDIKQLIDSKRKYQSMDCVYSCLDPHPDVEAFVPYLNRLSDKRANLFD